MADKITNKHIKESNDKFDNIDKRLSRLESVVYKNHPEDK